MCIKVWVCCCLSSKKKKKKRAATRHGHVEMLQGRVVTQKAHTVTHTSVPKVSGVSVHKTWPCSKTTWPCLVSVLKKKNLLTWLWLVLKKGRAFSYMPMLIFSPICFYFLPFLHYLTETWSKCWSLHDSTKIQVWISNHLHIVSIIA